MTRSRKKVAKLSSLNTCECGNKSAVFGKSKHNTYNVFCMSCARETAYYSTPEEAARKWNARVLKHIE